MPRYLFSYHAYLSWLPDRSRGYVARGKGILPRDSDMADRYRQNAKEPPVTFTQNIQRTMIDEVQVASKFQRFALYGIGGDPPHLHVLVGWADPRDWGILRNSIRTSLTRRLNSEFQKRTWFCEGASRKRVRDQAHFDYLLETYLPDHPGLKWSRERGAYL